MHKTVLHVDERRSTELHLGDVRARDEAGDDGQVVSHLRDGALDDLRSQLCGAVLLLRCRDQSSFGFWQRFALERAEPRERSCGFRVGCEIGVCRGTVVELGEGRTPRAEELHQRLRRELLLRQHLVQGALEACEVEKRVAEISRHIGEKAGDAPRFHCS